MIMRRLAGAAQTFQKHLREAQAEQNEQAISKAFRLKPLAEINPKKYAEVKAAGGPPRPTDVFHRDSKGRLMRYWSDGSLRREKEKGNEAR